MWHWFHTRNEFRSTSSPLPFVLQFVNAFRYLDVMYYTVCVIIFSFFPLSLELTFSREQKSNEKGTNISSASTIPLTMERKREIKKGNENKSCTKSLLFDVVLSSVCMMRRFGRDDINSMRIYASTRSSCSDNAQECAQNAKPCKSLVSLSWASRRGEQDRRSARATTLLSLTILIWKSLD